MYKDCQNEIDKANLNTYHVKVQLKYEWQECFCKENLNTYHVKVQWRDWTVV